MSSPRAQSTPSMTFFTPAGTEVPAVTVELTSQVGGTVLDGLGHWVHSRLLEAAPLISRPIRSKTGFWREIS
jgi:hypothetical protein